MHTAWHLTSMCLAKLTTLGPTLRRWRLASSPGQAAKEERAGAFDEKKAAPDAAIETADSAAAEEKSVLSGFRQQKRLWQRQRLWQRKRLQQRQWQRKRL